MSSDVMLAWTVRHRHCGRFVRPARLRDFFAMLAGWPVYEPGACSDCDHARDADCG